MKFSSPPIFLQLLLVFLTTLSSDVVAGRKKKTTVAPTTENIFQDELTSNGTSLYTDQLNPIVRIGSFNLKQFGQKKGNNEEILRILAKIISRYDLIALQEITDVKEKALKQLMQVINQESVYPYHYVVSPRVGRNKQKEQYALVFRPQVFQVKKDTLYDDSSEDVFSRDPHISEVICKANGEKFGLINVHVAPRNASTEINALTDVHSFVEDRLKFKNIILLGDLNADCDYIRKKDIPKIRLMNNNKYNWLIPKGFDTTVGDTSCAYDRIILTGPYLSDNLIPSSATVFKFDVEYNLNKKEALDISDHYPVEFSMRVQNANQSGKLTSTGWLLFHNQNILNVVIILNTLYYFSVLLFL